MQFLGKSHSFAEILRAHSKIPKKNSQGIIFRNNFVSEGTNKIPIFSKVMNFACKSLEKSFFPLTLRIQNPSKIANKNSQRYAFVIISCQRVYPFWKSLCWE